MARTLPIKTFRDYATPEVFQRGQRYYQQDAVNKFGRQGNTITARVYGSYNYRVNVTLLERSDKPNEYGLKSARCSCPYGDTFDGLCKHIIAVLLKFHHEGAAETVTAAKHQGGDARAKLAELSKEDLRGLLEHLFDHYPDAADVAAVFWQQQTITQQASAPQASTPQASAPQTSAPQASTTQPDATPAEAEIDTRPYCALMERAASQPDFGQGPICYPQAHELLEKVTPFLEASAYVDAFKLTWDLLETFIDTASNLDEDIIHEILYMDVYGDEYYDVMEDDSVAFGDSELLEAFDRLLAKASLGAQADISDDTRKARIEKLSAWEDSLNGEYAEVTFPLAIYALAGTFHVTNEETQHYQDYAEVNHSYAEADYHDLALDMMKRLQGEDAALSYAKAYERGLQYLTILLQRGDIDTVMGSFQDYVNSLEDIEQFVEMLAPRYPEHATAVGYYGIDYADALWQQRITNPYENMYTQDRAVYGFLENLCQVAARLNDTSLHFRAARLLFRILPTLRTFNTLRDLTDASDWQLLREALLAEMQQHHDMPEHAIKILLQEARFDDAINIITQRTSESQFNPYPLNQGIIWSVMDAVTDTHSAWVIGLGSQHAEAAIAKTQTSSYKEAVRYLQYVKRAYLASDQAEQWQAYAEKLATEHKRKRNFMALFKGLL